MVDTLLSIAEVYCAGNGAPCEALPDAVAQEFIEAEKAARKKLPRVQPAVRVKAPAQALGSLATGPVTISIRSEPATRDELVGVKTDLVATSGTGATVALATISEFDDRMEYAHLDAAYRSADGKHLAVVVAYGPGRMCWGPFDSLAFAVIDVEQMRAELAKGEASNR